jgi:hypothetical protein
MREQPPSARKFQFGSDPRLRNRWEGSVTLGTFSSPPASIRRTLTPGSPPAAVPQETPTNLIRG